MAEPSWDANTGPGPQIQLLDAVNCTEDWATSPAFRSAVGFRRKSVSGVVATYHLIFGAATPVADANYDNAATGSIYSDTADSGKISKKDDGTGNWTELT